MARNLRIALDLMAAGHAMMRQTLRRQFPDASEDELARRYGEWLVRRADAPDGDAPGVPRAPARHEP
jgi:hypothetical protein